jgi:sugar phosphate permease/phenylpyruvate tautomerase PptA (4-oxalocrotonate tautomerase family)
MPFIFICYLVAMVDRLNVGFAKLQFMSELHLTEAQFGVAASLLYAGYILFEIPSNLMMQRSGVGVMLLRIMTLWGVATILLGFARSANEFYILRFLVGLAEAGFLPGILLYMTYWFPERLRGRMTSLFVMAVPVSGIIGGPVAGWIMTSADGLYGMRGWRTLFLLEGAPAVILGITAYMLLPRKPADARWLTEQDCAALVRDIAAGQALAAGEPRSFVRALADIRVWGLALCYFLFYSLENALLVWIPTLLRTVGGLSIMTIGWLGGAISIVAVIGMQILSASSDRTRDRRWHVIGCGSVAGLCFMLLSLAAGSIAATTIILMVASVAVFGFLTLFWTIPQAYLRGTAAAGGLALISSVGALGGVVSPIYVGIMKDATGSFYGALGSLGAILLAGMPVLYACIKSAAARSGRERSRFKPAVILKARPHRRNGNTKEFNMPFYHCFSPAGLINSEQKREIAVATTDIHCRLTGAPRHFVHVVHQTYDETDAFSGGTPSRACLVRGFIRAGRTQDVKEELLRQLSELWTRVSGVSSENLLVSLAENAGTNVMEGGVLLSAPKDDAKWEAEHAGSRGLNS